MSRIRVMTVFGTRPEAVKMAPLVKELQKHDQIDTIVCVTAQHREQLDQVLEAFSIKPDFDLDIMEARQTLTLIFTKALTLLEGVMQEAKPDIVLVHGDTSTTFVASLAAYYQQIPIGHVEAGQAMRRGPGRGEGFRRENDSRPVPRDRKGFRYNGFHDRGRTRARLARVDFGGAYPRERD